MVPNPKNGVFYSFDHKRYQWYESEDPSSPRFWKKVVIIERKTTKIRLCTIKRVQFTGEKVKIIEVLYIKENN